MCVQKSTCYNKIILLRTDSLESSFVISLRHELSLERMIAYAGLIVYIVRLEERLWIKWNPSGIASSGRRSPKSSSSSKVSPDR